MKAYLTLQDISEAVGNVIKRQRHEILAHVERRIKLMETRTPRDEERFDNLHRRITKLEADIRILTRKGILR